MKLLQNAASKRAAKEGTMLCIDPTSGGTDSKGNVSVAGFAVFKGGKLVESGTIGFPQEKVVFKRLRNVLDAITKFFAEREFDLLVLEDIRGFKAQQSLIQSCGVYIVGIQSKEFFQPNVQTWKAVARMWGGYTKSDEQDAIYMGYAAIAIALGWKAKSPVAEKESIIAKAKELTLNNTAAEYEENVRDARRRERKKSSSVSSTATGKEDRRTGSRGRKTEATDKEE